MLHRITQPVDDLVIEKRQDLVPRIHQRHLDAQRRKHAGVLGADDARAENGHRLREPLDGQDLVAVVDLIVVEIDTVGAARDAPSRDQEVATGDALLARGGLHRHGVRVDEARVTAEVRDVVAAEVFVDARDLRFGDRVLALHQHRQGGRRLEIDRDAVERTGAVTR